MFGIILSLALSAMFILMFIEERSHIRTCSTLYQKRFDNKPISKDERLDMIAEELSLHTNARHIATHGCIICQVLNQLFTLSEAIPHLQRVRATAF